MYMYMYARNKFHAVINTRMQSIHDQGGQGMLAGVIYMYMYTTLQGLA